MFLNSVGNLIDKAILQKVIGHGENCDVKYGEGQFEAKDGKITPMVVPEMLDLEYLFSSSLCHPASFIKRQLIKDSIAVFSTDWLQSNFDMDVVVLIRHPAAFMASLKVKSWYHDFSHFLNPQEMMNHILKPFSNEIEAICRKEEDIIEQVILLWIISIVEFYSIKINTQTGYLFVMRAY